MEDFDMYVDENIEQENEKSPQKKAAQPSGIAMDALAGLLDSYSTGGIKVRKRVIFLIDKKNTNDRILLDQRHLYNFNKRVRQRQSARLFVRQLKLKSVRQVLRHFKHERINPKFLLNISEVNRIQNQSAKKLRRFNSNQSSNLINTCFKQSTNVLKVSFNEFLIRLPRNLIY